MRELAIMGVLFFNLIIQSSLFPFIKIFHVKPDSLLALVVSFALIDGNPMGMAVGLCGGLLQDILFGNNLGLYALQYMLVGYLVGILFGKLYLDGFFVPIIIITASSIIKHVIMLGYVFFSQSDIAINKAFLQIIIPETIYTLVLMPLIFKWISRLYDNKFMKRKWLISRGKPFS